MALGPSQPDDVWAAVLAHIADKPVLSWAANLQLVRLDERDVHLTVRPGHRDILRFAQQQRERLAELMGAVLNRPVRVEISAGSSEAAPLESDQQAPARDPDALSQQEAMSLPLVRQIAEHFDVTLLSARRTPRMKATDEPMTGEPTCSET